jgi:hypothetical protein
MSVITELLQRFCRLAGRGTIARFGKDLNAVAHMFMTRPGAVEDARWLFTLPRDKVGDFLRRWAGRNNLGDDVQRVFGVDPVHLRTLTTGPSTQTTLIEGGLRVPRVLDDYAATANVNFAMVRDGERVMIDLWFPAAIGYGSSRSGLMTFMAERIRELGGHALSPNLVNMLGGAGQTFRPVVPTLR